MDLKEKIRDLLKNHTEYGAKIKKPCVTVTYKKDGEAAYHVDLMLLTFMKTKMILTVSYILHVEKQGFRRNMLGEI